MSATATRSGPLVGAANLTRREAATWWSTGRWRVQAVVWTLLMGGLLAAMLWVFPALIEGTDAAATMGDGVRDTARQFPDLLAVIVAVGVVLLTQGIVLDERRDGVLEWLLSKPLARPAVVVAKFLGHGSGLLVTVLLLPWLVVHGVLSIAAGQLWSPVRSLAAVGALALVVVFHLALVLALSAITESRVVILAVPIAAVVSADAVTGILPEAFDVMPWSLGAIASVLLADGVLVSAWPLLATIGWTLALLVLAAAALQRSEL